MKALYPACFALILALGAEEYRANNIVQHQKLGLNAGQAILKTIQAGTSVIDGLKHPDLIPDETALHLIMLTASVREDESDDKKGRANAVLQSLKLDTVDRNAFTLQANQYRKDFLKQ